MRQLFAPILSKIRSAIWRPAIRPYIVYALFMAIVFAGIARLDHSFFQTIPAAAHVALLMLLAFILGILFLRYALEKYFAGPRPGIKTLLVAGGNYWGIAFYYIICRKLGIQDQLQVYTFAYAPALLAFSLPWLFVLTVQALADVPALRYAPLIVGHLRDVIAEHRWADNRDKGIRWVFEDGFTEVSSSGKYDFRTYTPFEVEGMEIETLFKGLLSLHNHNLSPARPILFETADGPYGWHFQHCPYWFLPGFRCAISPLRTVKKNGLRFRKITEEERSRSKEKLSPRFRVATLYISRGLVEEARQSLAYTPDLVEFA